MLRKWFLNNGVALNEVSIVEIPMPQLPDVLRQGSVDAVVIVEPLRSRALASGAGYELANYTAEVFPDGPGIIIGALRSWAEANRLAVDAFRLAIDDAENFIRTNQDEARQIEAKFLLGAVSPVFPPAMSSKITVEDFEFFNKVGKELGIYKGTITDLNKLFIK
jgi:NitT/TauT family transport system substrate-binding protein